MSQKKYLSVKNFDQLQMYKDRNPIWIKLYCSILDDYEFAQIPDETKFHAVGLMLLASRLNNKFPEDERWLRQKINANREINLKLLLEIGFLTQFKAARTSRKNSLNDGKSLKTNGESVTENENARSVEHNRGEQRRTEKNTPEQTNAAAAAEDETADAARCAVENLSKPEESEKSARINQGSAFSVEECLKYAELCANKGEAIRNPQGLASHLFKTGAADAFIRRALYPERQAAIERASCGAPVEFSDQPCSICFGAKMAADADGRGFRRCRHCLNERGKPTGLEPLRGDGGDGGDGGERGGESNDERNDEREKK